VLAGDDSDHQEADDLVLAQELPLQGARELPKSFVSGADAIARAAGMGGAWCAVSPTTARPNRTIFSALPHPVPAPVPT